MQIEFFPFIQTTYAYHLMRVERSNHIIPLTIDLCSLFYFTIHYANLINRFHSAVDKCEYACQRTVEIKWEKFSFQISSIKFKYFHTIKIFLNSPLYCVQYTSALSHLNVYWNECMWICFSLSLTWWICFSNNYWHYYSLTDGQTMWKV